MSTGAVPGAQRELELDRRVAELEDHLALELEERLEDGRCGCGCDQQLLGRGGNGRKRYVDERHRKRRNRDVVKRLAEVRGVPVRQSIQTLQTPIPSSHRPADAQPRRKAPQKRRRDGVSIYLPSVERAAAALDVIRHGRDLELVAAELEPIAELLAAALERRRRRDARATRASTRG